MLHRSPLSYAAPCLLALALAAPALAACGGKAASGPAAPGIYEEFDVTMLDGGTCLAATRAKWECPPGGTCSGPPPKDVECPTGLTPGATVHLIMSEDLTCSVDGAPTPCPVHDTGPVEVPPE
jgi:hypothetical protein